MKKKRQEQIIEIIQNHEVETQEDLAGYLTEAGYAVTQATVSRDIRELSLEKVPGQKVRQKYAMRSTIPVAAEIKHPAAQPANRYATLLQDGIVSMEQAGNLLVIKTAVGMAMAVAAALDAMEIEGIIGCIAGDDTIMCAVKTEKMVQNVIENLQNLILQIK
ncbi:MAG: arginine repressor [Roseburia sp.]|jgi:transcriptional regulator of arginine metabolism|nr:arginine repressor [Roseburia sp.]MCI5496364.1 arginine repressor [Roseburia sp.]